MSLCPHGYSAFWDCPHCEEPMGTAPIHNPDDAAPPEADFCSRCGAHAGFFWDDDPDSNGGWVSDCCGYPPRSVEPPAWLEDR